MLPRRSQLWTLWKASGLAAAKTKTLLETHCIARWDLPGGGESSGTGALRMDPLGGESKSTGANGMNLPGGESRSTCAVGTDPPGGELSGTGALRMDPSSGELRGTSAVRMDPPSGEPSGTLAVGMAPLWDVTCLGNSYLFHKVKVNNLQSWQTVVEDLPGWKLTTRLMVLLTPHRNQHSKGARWFYVVLRGPDLEQKQANKRSHQSIPFSPVHGTLGDPQTRCVPSSQSGFFPEGNSTATFILPLTSSTGE